MQSDKPSATIRIITFNANGIRAAARKGFFTWLADQQADIVCVQETKVQRDQLAEPVYFPEGYHCYYYDAQKKGYSGTAVYSRVEPQRVTYGMGWDLADSEGRVIQSDYPNLSVINLYLPSGSSGAVRQQHKYQFLDKLYDHMDQLRQQQRELILCADWNICHQEIDLKNWKANSKNSGFLPEERAWLNTVYDKLEFIDSFRLINQQAEQYTWWSNRGQAWAKNVGWRLDYQMITPGLKDKVLRAEIYKAQRFSDHAPLIMDYEWELQRSGTAKIIARPNQNE